MITKAQLDKIARRFERLAKQATAEIFFCGGHGGLVTYSKGSPMIKEGGPMDRIFLLRKRGEMGGNIGLDIAYGSIKFSTGPLAQDVEIVGPRGRESEVTYTFEGNRDPHIVEVRGQIVELGLPIWTVLFHASVEPSRMRWILGRGPNALGSLPYTAYHHNVYLHPAIYKRFELPGDSAADAACGWCKPEPSRAGMEFSREERQGAEFRTQQHLGNMRIFVRSK